MKFTQTLIFPGNGYIEGTELDSFLREFVASVNSSDSGPEVGQQGPCIKFDCNLGGGQIAHIISDSDINN